MEITTIGGLIVLVIIIAGIFLYYKFCIPKNSDKEEAQKFIEGFKGVFEEIIQRIINEVDITKYKTVEEFESDVFAIAYDECWNYTEKALQEACENSVIGSLIAKCITKDTVEEFIKNIISSGYLDKLEAVYSARWQKTTADAIAEDARLQAEADAYETGEKEVEPAGELPDEEPPILNPQRDEEEGYDPDDISQEIVGESEETENTTKLEFDDESSNYVDEE